MVASLLLGMALVATAATAQSVPELAAVSQNWARAWAAGDLDATLALYADDAVFMDANGSRVAGKADLKNFFATVLAQYGARPVLRSVRSESAGDLGYDWGDYTEIVTPRAHPDRAIQVSGTYVAIVRKIAGRWRIADQVWTGNVPVPVKR